MFSALAFRVALCKPCAAGHRTTTSVCMSHYLVNNTQHISAHFRRLSEPVIVLSRAEHVVKTRPVRPDGYRPTRQCPRSSRPSFTNVQLGYPLDSTFLPTRRCARETHAANPHSLPQQVSFTCAQRRRVHLRISHPSLLTTRTLCGSCWLGLWRDKACSRRRKLATADGRPRATHCVCRSQLCLTPALSSTNRTR